MSKRRLILSDQMAYYHVFGRMVRREFWFGEREREVFVAMLRKQAAFTGVQVITYCMMGNHFHLLLQVPRSPLRAYVEGDPTVSDELLLERYEGFYGTQVPRSSYSLEELKDHLAAGGVVADLARKRVLKRMGDLSYFMRELKQRFMIWFNDTHDNEGTVWSARFKSVLVEAELPVLARVANYIDLNPVRAGIVSNPAEYAWSGFGAAEAGDSVARRGFAQLFGAGLERGDRVVLKEALATYRQSLAAFMETSQGKGEGGEDEPPSCGEDLGFLLRARVVGSEDFVRSLGPESEKLAGSSKRSPYGFGELCWQGLRLFFLGRRCRE